MHKLSRRNFLNIASIAGTALMVKPVQALAFEERLSNEKGLIFLFQGDSITDGNRGRNADPNHIMGHGYAYAVASRIAADFAENNFKFYNRGISGNKIPDLLNRWQTDAIELKPDVLSILVGVNDVAAVVNKKEEAQSPEQFEAGYRNLLQQSKTAKPDSLLVLALPFVYPAPKLKDKWNEWRNETDKRIIVVKKLSEEFNAILIDYSPIFDKAIKRMPVDYWIWDGIHPTIAGHELMAREWIKQVSARLKFLKRYKY